MADAFDILSANFLKWFQTKEVGATFNENLALRDLRHRGAGRGIVALNDIAPETVLFTIPRAAVITSQTSGVSECLRRAAKEHGAEQPAPNDSDSMLEVLKDPWMGLVVALIYEHFQGDQSRWKPYIDVLPTSFDTPMFWDEDEIAELQASTVKDKIGKSGADAIFREKIIPLIRRFEDVFYPERCPRLSEDELLGVAHRMGSTIMAYAFDLDTDEDSDEETDEQDGWVVDTDDSKALGMVPMADILNSDAEFNAHLIHEEGQLVMQAIRMIPAGEEVLNYYGPLPTSDLVRRYGYTSPKHTRYDIVELSWESVVEAAQSYFDADEASLKAFEKSIQDSDDMEESFVLERDSGEPDDSGLLVSEARFVDLPVELKHQVKRLVVFLRKYQGNKNRDSDAQSSVTFDCLQIVSRSLDKRIAEYTTTIAQDKQILSNKDFTERSRMAVLIRCGEKLLLGEARAAIARQLHNLSETDSTSRKELPQSKKMKHAH